jgi:ribosomal protein S18 acetylase RimI-like enzyme
VQITEMTPADYDAAIALWQATEGIGLSGADSRECITAFLKRNPGLSLVARSNGALAGAVLCGNDGRRGFLHHLAVAPEFRHRGIGTRLVETCLSRLGALGIQKCHIFVLADNQEGAGFWQTLGWIERPGIKMMSKDIAVATDHSPAG